MMLELGNVGKGEVLLTSAFIAYETSFNFSQFLPSIMTIRSFVDTTDKLHAIRHGEMIATVYSGAFAIIFSAILRSWLPFGLAVVAIAATVAVYEWALAGSPVYTGVGLGGATSMYGDSESDG